jgi:hypothetical protein
MEDAPQGRRQGQEPADEPELAAVLAPARTRQACNSVAGLFCFWRRRAVGGRGPRRGGCQAGLARCAPGTALRGGVGAGSMPVPGLALALSGIFLLPYTYTLLVNLYIYSRRSSACVYVENEAHKRFTPYRWSDSRESSPHVVLNLKFSSPGEVGGNCEGMGEPYLS